MTKANPPNRLETLRRIAENARRTGERPASSIPSWRRIEMLRERRALMEALDDPLEEHPEPDENIFLSESEQAERFFTPGSPDLDENVPEIDEDEPGLD